MRRTFTRAPFVIITVMLLASASRCLGQNEPNSAAQVMQIQSEILKQSRSISISKPDGYDGGTGRYAVLYLLDAESNLEYTAAIVHALADNEFIPEMIVVGINSGDSARRTHDLTPPSQAEIDNRFSPGNGGADAFLSFIADELVPYIERNYRTRPYRILVGHSIGGLFAIHALITTPKLFNAYIAIDPTIAWNNEAEIAAVRRFCSQVKELQAGLFITAANMFGTATPGVRALVGVLDGNTPQGFRWKFEYMEDENHISIPLPSIYYGLKTIFDGWYLVDPLLLFDQGGLEAIDKHFREGGKRYGYDRTTPPFAVSLVVAGLIKTGRLEDASTVLLHDPKLDPPPWNQLDALARAYAERGNTQQAIRYYTLSLQENPNNTWARKS
jgi:predicted alpha/beta superfamily hydrolase